MAMAANYTDEQVEMMRERYQAKPTRETVENLAEELNKSIKSIIGKLSREGIYQKAIYKTKTGEIPITKSQLIEKMAELLDIDSSKIIGLEKAPKQDIKYLFEVLGGDFDGNA
jgi:altronate dehydratase|tara:strand:- start:324 stop:662 length:339 start_codon:yes stop_codon:yes gene_type:complete